jgi:aspartate ammonia-lyase
MCNEEVDTAVWREERDLLGSEKLSSEKLYGINTWRALNNFSVGGSSIGQYPSLIDALAAVKQAAAQTNRELGLLDTTVGKAIEQACHSIREGRHHDQFVVDMVQGGAGTSTNMNANEVIANIALQSLGRPIGDYGFIHPIDHVNYGQSTNDVYPTALRISLHQQIPSLLTALSHLCETFTNGAIAFQHVLKVGRTQLQDAVPMTVGQEFGGYAHSLARSARRLEHAQEGLAEINIGGTAIGTAINSHPRYRAKVLVTLRSLTGIDRLKGADNLIDASSDVSAFVNVSGAMKMLAVTLSKICNDLRLLSSGPQGGLGEINLPPRQAGSSIMPGKINPVIPELVNQICFQVIGYDLTVTMAAEAGQLELNAFEPIIAKSLFDSIGCLTAGVTTLSSKCVAGITVNTTDVHDMAVRSAGLATALNPVLGYTTTAAIVQRALHKGRPVADIVAELGLLSDTHLQRLLSVENLTGERSAGDDRRR